MFYSNTSNVNFMPEDGMKVLVKGKVSVFPSTGNYQIYVSEMTQDGIGNLYALYEELKKKLQAEGYFDESHKKKIPSIPSTIGIVTAQTGAAIKDILSTLNRRFPLCKTILFPSLVQGKEAAEDIANKIKIADSYNLDVLIVGRGGGSIEDLWAFNEKVVADAIYNASTPIISAVGHEVDFTIADFVADLRAATPTGAAELAVPDKEELKNLINQYSLRINKLINNNIEKNKDILERIKNSYIMQNPMTMYEIKEQVLSTFIDRLNTAMLSSINTNNLLLNSIKSSFIFTNPLKIYENKFNRFNNVVDKLNVLNPLNTLKRGYAVVKHDDKIITSINDAKINDEINVRVNDGEIKSKIIEVKEI